MKSLDLKDLANRQKPPLPGKWGYNYRYSGYGLLCRQLRPGINCTKRAQELYKRFTQQPRLRRAQRRLGRSVSPSATERE